MKESHLVSVLMPAYNAQNFIQKAIDSVLSSSYSNLELLIADDCSVDSTWQIINMYSDARIRTFRNKSNQGYLKTWNYLISQAKGDYISFCDADDLISVTKIEKQVNFLINNKNVNICGCDIAVIDENENLILEKSFPADNKSIKEKLLSEKEFPFAGSAVMIHRKVYEEVGGYRDFYDRLGWEDHDWIIMCCGNFESANISDKLYFYRQTTGSVTRSYDETNYQKLFIKRIGIKIARTRIEMGSDLLDASNFWNLHRLVSEFEKDYINDNSRLYYQLAVVSTTRKERLLFLKRAIKTKPYALKYYFKFLQFYLSENRFRSIIL